MHQQMEGRRESGRPSFSFGEWTMKRLIVPALFFILAVLSPTGRTITARAHTGPGDHLLVTGTVSNSHGGPVENAELNFYANGRKVACTQKATTSGEGRYSAKLVLPHGLLPEAKIEIDALKPCFKIPERVLVERLAKEVGPRGKTPSTLPAAISPSCGR